MAFMQQNNWKQAQNTSPQKNGPQQFQKRAPAVEKSIADITDKDIRARILGTIIGIADMSLIIDDGTGKIEVIFDDANMMAGLAEGSLVRVIARILPLIDGFECRGECVQNLEGFDVGLYKKVRKIIG